MGGITQMSLAKTNRAVKQKYKEGDWFTVPLPGGGYAVGLIARMAAKGRTVPFGYFFGPRRPEIPTVNEIADLQPLVAILLKKFGVVDLANGRWSVLGRLPNWDLDKWRMPSFLRSSIPPDTPLGKSYYLRTRQSIC